MEVDGTGMHVDMVHDPIDNLHYTITVDTSQVDALNKQLEEMRDLFAVPESMATFWQRLRWLITGKVR
jgi:hypothetical protein